MGGGGWEVVTTRNDHASPPRIDQRRDFPRLTALFGHLTRQCIPVGIRYVLEAVDELARATAVYTPHARPDADGRDASRRSAWLEASAAQAEGILDSMLRFPAGGVASGDGDGDGDDGDGDDHDRDDGDRDGLGGWNASPANLSFVAEQSAEWDEGAALASLATLAAAPPAPPLPADVQACADAMAEYMSRLAQDCEYNIAMPFKLYDTVLRNDRLSVNAFWSQVRGGVGAVGTETGEGGRIRDGAPHRLASARSGWATTRRATSRPSCLVSPSCESSAWL